MTPRRGLSSPGGISGVGNDWAAQKLGALACYLSGYTKILRQKSVQKAYIDAFASTGYRKLRREDANTGALLFPDLARTSSQALLKGAGRVALQVEPRFDRFLFIDCEPKRNSRFEALKYEFADRAADIHVVAGQANETIRSLGDRDWHNRRAVLLLDPFGMQVEWSTLEAIGRTRSIDMWLFLPLGFGATLRETGSGGIPALWWARLASLLGGQNWCGGLQNVEKGRTWSDGIANTDVGNADAVFNDAVGRRISERLTQVFAGVVGPGVLRGASNTPLYLVCFAAGNPRAIAPFLRQAQTFLDAMG